MSNEELEQFLSGFTVSDGEPFEVTSEGSLGLLALGDLGLAAWRMVRARDAQEQEKETDTTHA